MQYPESGNFIFNWVLINELAIGNFPKTVESIKVLQNNKIKSILNLCSREECDFKEDFQNKFNYINFPLPDHKSSKIPELDEFKKVLKHAEELISKGPLFVHCYASMERSPLVCLGLLVKKEGLALEDALVYLKQVHKSSNPLPNQVKLIKNI